MPKMEMTPNDKEFYRGECVRNEYSATENWTKKYGPKMPAFDGMYKQLPGMQRCIAGLDIASSLQYIEQGGLEEPPRPQSITVKEMSQKSYLPRPKSGAHQNVGLGGLGVHSDFMEPPRAADTIYERDYCVRLEEFGSQIQGHHPPLLAGPHKGNDLGTMSVIPTSWQFPSGTKQPEAFLERSELRKLRLERDAKRKQEEKRGKAGVNTENQATFVMSYNPLKVTSRRSSTSRKAIPEPAASEVGGSKKETTNHARVLVRGGRPSQSRSWAPANNTAPRGWYKIDVGPGKLQQEPDMMTVLNTPQVRLNVLKRRIDLRQAALNSGI